MLSCMRLGGTVRLALLRSHHPYAPLLQGCTKTHILISNKNQKRVFSTSPPSPPPSPPGGSPSSRLELYWKKLNDKFKGKSLLQIGIWATLYIIPFGVTFGLLQYVFLDPILFPSPSFLDNFNPVYLSAGIALAVTESLEFIRSPLSIFLAKIRVKIGRRNPAINDLLTAMLGAIEATAKELSLLLDKYGLLTEDNITEIKSTLVLNKEYLYKARCHVHEFEKSLTPREKKKYHDQINTLQAVYKSLEDRFNSLQNQAKPPQNSPQKSATTPQNSPQESTKPPQ